METEGSLRRLKGAYCCLLRARWSYPISNFLFI